MEQLLLVLNPGSTSTKLALFRDLCLERQTGLHHSNEELAPFAEITEQRGFRESLIVDWLKKEQVPLASLTAIVARGGLLAPLPGGTYAINAPMVKQLEQGLYGKHASNLAALIAYDLSLRLNIPAFIVDPVVVDELSELARFSGVPGLERKSIFHALNHKAGAKKAAKSLGRPYVELNLIVAHLGGGISVGAHRQGQVIDVNNALSGEGPFSPERSGSLPTRGLINYYFQRQAGKSELIGEFVGRSGLIAHLGTNDCRLIETRAEAGDGQALLYLQALAFQVAKEVGRMSTVLAGQVDALVLTGGLAYSALLMEEIKKRIGFIAPLIILPGENELEALAHGAWQVLTGAEEVRHYAAGEVN